MPFLVEDAPTMFPTVHVVPGAVKRDGKPARRLRGPSRRARPGPNPRPALRGCPVERVETKLAGIVGLDCEVIGTSGLAQRRVDDLDLRSDDELAVGFDDPAGVLEGRREEEGGARSGGDPGGRPRRSGSPRARARREVAAAVTVCSESRQRARGRSELPLGARVTELVPQPNANVTRPRDGRPVLQ